MIWPCEALAGFEDQRLERLDYRRPLVADVAGGRVLEAGFGGAGAEDLAQFVEADLFADVELDQDEDGAAQRVLAPASIAADLGGEVVGDDGCRFAIHGFAVITPDGLKRIVPSCGAAIGSYSTARIQIHKAMRTRLTRNNTSVFR